MSKTHKCSSVTIVPIDNNSRPIERVHISDLRDECDLQPSQIYRWQKQARLCHP